MRGNLAWVVYRQGRVQEADSLYRSVTASQSEARPNAVETAQSLLDHGELRTNADDPAEAETLAAEALGILRAAVGDDNLRTVRARNLAALNLARLDRLDEAEAHLLASHASLERLAETPGGEAATYLPYVEGLLAQLYDLMEHPEDAERYRARARDGGAA